ncbi:MAG: PaaI family thioesterase [Chloroflexota bacterium]
MEQSHDREAARERITGSPIYKYLDLHLDEMGEGHSRLRLQVRDEFRQIYGAVHGGIIATVADSCIGTALISLIDETEKAVTVDLRVNYIAPLLSGELVGEGRIVHKGRTLAFGEAELRDGDGRLVATASATYMAIRNGV